jgi:hypothetical protein
MTLLGFKTILHKKCRSGKNSEGPAENSWVLDLCPAKWTSSDVDLRKLKTAIDLRIGHRFENLKKDIDLWYVEIRHGFEN